ncbi:hypothetical protein E2562_001673 [Oryza meyeriana var. granulata]|uniref:Uncharacterized protein n=1 Tax=Oryza meyeriana var. granulata TaxID=110450 RepID=A0A6G1CEE0_9ORYZ|nr:hypothetical protein E2562_001673 [Oryza meyeriana var. granulata]
MATIDLCRALLDPTWKELGGMMHGRRDQRGSVRQHVQMGLELGCHADGEQTTCTATGNFQICLCPLWL